MSGSECDLSIRGQFGSAIFPKLVQLANQSHVNSILQIKYEVTNKTLSFYIQLFILCACTFNQNAISENSAYYFN